METTLCRGTRKLSSKEDKGQISRRSVLYYEMNCAMVLAINWVTEL
jgi:hypothetical protein